MLPDIGQRLGAVIRSLEDVVIPAIDPADRPAIEQARLCIAAIRIACEQEPHAYAVAIAELRLFAGLARTLHSIAGAGLDEDIRTKLDSVVAAGWQEVQAPSRAELELAATQVREVVQAIVQQSAALPTSQRDAIDAAIIGHAEADGMLRRVWMAGSGVEAETTKLSSLSAVTAAGIAPLRSPAKPD